jgi:RNA recognition motif-containing protein
MQMFEKHHTAVGELEKAGIKRVRLGTFEDTGKCKGSAAVLSSIPSDPGRSWAFVDFDSPTLATLALLNTRNYKIQDKPLKIEFATEDAVRRGANFRPPRPEKAADKKKARRERDRVVPPRTKAASMGQKRLLDGEVDDAPKGKKIKFEEEDPVVEVVGTLEGVQTLERPEKKRKAREAEDGESGEKSKKRKGADGPAAAKPKKRKKEKISED